VTQPTAPADPVTDASPVPTLLRVAGSWSWRILAIGAVLWLALQLAMRIKVILVALLLALFLTAILTPVVDAAQRRGVNRTLGSLGVLLLAGAAAAGVTWLVVPRVGAQVGNLREALLQALDAIRRWLADGPLSLAAGQIDDLRQAAMDVLPGSGDMGAVAVSGTRLVLGLVAGLVLTTFFTFFFLRDGADLAAWVVQRLPDRWQDRADRAAAAVWHTLSRYTAGVVALATFNAVATGAGLLAIGVPLVLPLVAIEFGFSFIPFVGPIVAGLLAALVALADGGLRDAVLVLALAFAIEQLEGHVIQPLTIGHAVDLHPVVVATVATCAGLLVGLLGALLAVPLTATIAAAAVAIRDTGGR
jgi:predicted PurR-regulated permease PerM